MVTAINLHPSLPIITVSNKHAIYNVIISVGTLSSFVPTAKAYMYHAKSYSMDDKSTIITSNTHSAKVLAQQSACM